MGSLYIRLHYYSPFFHRIGFSVNAMDFFLFACLWAFLPPLALNSGLQLELWYLKIVRKGVSVDSEDKKIIIDIIKKELPRARIFLYGSRARRDNRPESDVDIALDDNQKIENFTLSAIREAIEESTVPFMVDIIDLNAVSGDFKKEILKDGVLWT